MGDPITDLMDRLWLKDVSRTGMTASDETLISGPTTYCPVASTALLNVSLCRM